MSSPLLSTFKMDPSAIPQLPPPTYLASDSRTASVISAAIIPVVSSTAFVALRLYTRLFILKSRLMASDWVIILACVCAICYAAGFAGGDTEPQYQSMASSFTDGT